MKLLDSRRHYLWVALVLFVVCWLTYGRQVSTGFMLDDYKFVSGEYNRYFKTLPDYFQITKSQHYKPIYYLTNITLFHYFKHQPVALHVINAMVFYLSCVLFYVLLVVLNGRRQVAFLSSVLLCVHPIHSFVVSFITANFIFVFAVFMQMSFIFCWMSLEREDINGRLYYALSLVFFVLSLLCFEGALLFPVYLGCALYFLKRWPLQKVVKNVIPFFIPAGCYLSIWYFIAGPQVGLMDKIAVLNINSFSYLASFFILSSWYCFNLVFPFTIVFMKNIAPVEQHVLVYLILFAVCVAVVIALLKLFWKRDERSFALTWFLTGFALACLGVFAHSYMGLVFEPHWLYFSSMGFFFLSGIIVVNLQRFVQFRVWMICVLGLLITYFSFTQQYNHFARTEKDYCEYWLDQSPGNTVALMALARIAKSAGEFGKALDYYEGVLRVSKSEMLDADVYHNMGVLYSEINQPVRAEEMFLKAIGLRPRFAMAFHSLGVFYGYQHQFDKAEGNFLKALSLDPDLFLYSLSLASFYTYSGDQQKAVLILEDFLKRNPAQNEYQIIQDKLTSLKQL